MVRDKAIRKVSKKRRAAIRNDNSSSLALRYTRECHFFALDRSRTALGNPAFAVIEHFLPEPKLLRRDFQ